MSDEKTAFKMYTLPYKPNNIEALHERLQTVFGERYQSMGSSDEGVWFRMTDEAEGDEATLRTELDAHDPKQLTRRQQMVEGRAEAFKRLIALDTEAKKADLRGKKPEEMMDNLLDIIADLQKLLFTG